MSEPKESPKQTVTQPELAVFTRQLGAMLGADVNVLRALRIASQHVGNERLIAAADDLADRLSDGQELHYALAQHPDLFDAFYVEMTRQGEADGTLGPALLAVADYLDHPAFTTPVPSAGFGAPPPVAAAVPTRTGALALLALGVGMLGAAIAAGGVAAGAWSPAWGMAIGLGWLGASLAGTAYAAWPREATRIPAPTARPTPPPKTRERKQAETEGVVRNAVMEQQEAEEAHLAERFRMREDFTAWSTPEPEEPRER